MPEAGVSQENQNMTARLAEMHGKIKGAPIYAAFGGGFGDCWALASYLVKESEAAGRPAQISDIDPRVAAIVPHLSTSGSIVKLLSKATHLFCSPSVEDEFKKHFGYLPDIRLRWKICFSLRYTSTKMGWRGDRIGQIAYQLVPGYPGAATSCEEGQIERFLQTAAELNFKTVALGNHWSIAENIAIAAASEFFVGVDSGMSHLCHSVGIPVHLVRNQISEQHLMTTHSGNSYQRYATLPDFEQALRCWSPRFR